MFKQHLLRIIPVIGYSLTSVDPFPTFEPTVIKEDKVFAIGMCNYRSDRITVNNDVINLFIEYIITEIVIYNFVWDIGAEIKHCG